LASWCTSQVVDLALDRLYTHTQLPFIYIDRQYTAIKVQELIEWFANKKNPYYKFKNVYSSINFYFFDYDMKRI